jgi:hypothetical protein
LSCASKGFSHIVTCCSESIIKDFEAGNHRHSGIKSEKWKFVKGKLMLILKMTWQIIFFLPLDFIIIFIIITFIILASSSIYPQRVSESLLCVHLRVYAILNTKHTLTNISLCYGMKQTWGGCKINFLSSCYSFDSIFDFYEWWC